jgi:hypothetical protein
MLEVNPSQRAIGQRSEISYWDAGAWLSGFTLLSGLLFGVSWTMLPSPDGTLMRFLEKEAMWARMNVTLSASDWITLSILLLVFLFLVRAASKLSIGLRHIKVRRQVRFAVQGDELE